jgi:hypothetical protein
MPEVHLPSIPLIPAGTYKTALDAVKEILEVRNNRRPVGSLDRFVSVRHLTEDAEVVAAITSALSGIFYLGSSGSDGTWRLRVSGTDLLIERRESGSYVTKGKFTP